MGSVKFGCTKKNLSIRLSLIVLVAVTVITDELGPKMYLLFSPSICDKIASIM